MWNITEQTLHKLLARVGLKAFTKYNISNVWGIEQKTQSTLTIPYASKRTWRTQYFNSTCSWEQCGQAAKPIARKNILRVLWIERTPNKVTGKLWQLLQELARTLQTTLNPTCLPNKIKLTYLWKTWQMMDGHFT